MFKNRILGNYPSGLSFKEGYALFPIVPCRPAAPCAACSIGNLKSQKLQFYNLEKLYFKDNGNLKQIDTQVNLTCHFINNHSLNIKIDLRLQI